MSIRAVPAVAFLAIFMPIRVPAARAQAPTVRRSESETITSAEAPRWEIALDGRVGVPRGFVKVGEFDRSGDRLGLHQDLGIDTFEVAELRLAYHVTPRDVLRGRASGTFLYGTTTLDRDVAFNGALIGAGEELRTRPQFVRATLLYEHEFVRTAGGATLAGGGGLTFVYLHFSMHGTLAATTVGHETGEDFQAQELPIPLVSLRGEYPLAPRLSALAEIEGGALPKVDSLRNEGGTVKLAQAHADVFLGLRYALTERLFADGGYSYTYFSQHETSREDDNKILFLGHGFGFALTYLF